MEYMVMNVAGLSLVGLLVTDNAVSEVIRAAIQIFLM